MSTEKTLDPKYLAVCLQGYAALLQVGQFPKTAQILKCFAKVIEAEAANDKFYDENYPKLETTLRKEFCLDKNWRPKLFADTDAIINAASQAPEELQIALRLVEATKIRQENVNRIMFVATKETDEVSKIYLLCFVYLLLLQGIYDQFIGLCVILCVWVGWCEHQKLNRRFSVLSGVMFVIDALTNTKINEHFCSKTLRLRQCDPLKNPA